MALALLITWRRARQNVIRLPEAMAWSIVWIVAAVVVLLPNVTTKIAEIVGVGRGVDLVVYSAVAILFLLVFKLFIQHEKLERKLTDAVRAQAMQSIVESETQNSKHGTPTSDSEPINSPNELINFMIKERDKMHSNDE